MKTISILPMIALFGVAAVSSTPASQSIDGNPCEYFGMKKEWCVDGTFSPEFFAHLGDSSGNRHSPGSKRDDIKNGYKWPEGLMEAHNHAEFAKRSHNDILLKREEEPGSFGPGSNKWGMKR